MSKIEKLLIELVHISYANMLFNTLLAKTVVTTLASSIEAQEVAKKEIDDICESVEEYAHSLDKDLGGSANGK